MSTYIISKASEMESADSYVAEQTFQTGTTTMPPVTDGWKFYLDATISPSTADETIDITPEKLTSVLPRMGEKVVSPVYLPPLYILFMRNKLNYIPKIELSLNGVLYFEGKSTFYARDRFRALAPLKDKLSMETSGPLKNVYDVCWPLIDTFVTALDAKTLSLTPAGYINNTTTIQYTNGDCSVGYIEVTGITNMILVSAGNITITNIRCSDTASLTIIAGGNITINVVDLSTVRGNVFICGNIVTIIGMSGTGGANMVIAATDKFNTYAPGSNIYSGFDGSSVNVGFTIPLAAQYPVDRIVKLDGRYETNTMQNFTGAPVYAEGVYTFDLFGKTTIAYEFALLNYLKHMLWYRFDCSDASYSSNVITTTFKGRNITTHFAFLSTDTQSLPSISVATEASALNTYAEDMAQTYRLNQVNEHFTFWKGGKYFTLNEDGDLIYSSLPLTLPTGEYELTNYKGITYTSEITLNLNMMQINKTIAKKLISKSHAKFYPLGTDITDKTFSETDFNGGEDDFHVASDNSWISACRRLHPKPTNIDVHLCSTYRSMLPYAPMNGMVVDGDQTNTDVDNIEYGLFNFRSTSDRLANVAYRKVKLQQTSLISYNNGTVITPSLTMNEHLNVASYYNTKNFSNDMEVPALITYADSTIMHIVHHTQFYILPINVEVDERGENGVSTGKKWKYIDDTLLYNDGTLGYRDIYTNIILGTAPSASEVTIAILFGDMMGTYGGEFETTSHEYMWRLSDGKVWRTRNPNRKIMPHENEAGIFFRQFTDVGAFFGGGFTLDSRNAIFLRYAHVSDPQHAPSGITVVGRRESVYPYDADLATAKVAITILDGTYTNERGQTVSVTNGEILVNDLPIFIEGIQFVAVRSELTAAGYKTFRKTLAEAKADLLTYAPATGDLSNIIITSHENINALDAFKFVDGSMRFYPNDLKLNNPELPGTMAVEIISTTSTNPTLHVLEISP